MRPPATDALLPANASAAAVALINATINASTVNATLGGGFAFLGSCFLCLFLLLLSLLRQLAKHLECLAR